LLFGSPSGAYFPKGIRPVSVWISTDYTRAAPGGTGEAKCSGNYAASLVAQQEANRQGCEQVVWLDAKERRHIEEMGGMNLFFVYSVGGKTKLVTPRLTGTLLPGVTRDSLLKLAVDLGYEVEEGTLSVDQWRADIQSGAMTEVFACGTAAVITPVGQVKSKVDAWTIGDGETGPVAARLRAALLDIQHGRSADPYGWMHRVC
jgi:branched-chain amino acid aminotransferase